MHQTVALIGCGEAGTSFAAAAAWRGHARAFDVIASRAAALAQFGITAASSAAEALASADIALSLVTADEALLAATSAAPALRPGALWCDFNSVAPDTKRTAAEIVHAAGGRYVDVAVLAPVHPARLAVPLLVAGAAAEDARASLADLGFANIRVVGEEVGRASAIKMIRSVMIKGVEALTDEMMAAAQAAGVADEVLASLDASERRDRWQTRAAYNLERMRAHGFRRAAEMEEAAKTLRALGVDPVMTGGTIRRQRGAAHAPPAEMDAA
ncbi:MAG: DUF1932 domain-containing protein [Tsuneonella sp.]